MTGFPSTVAAGWARWTEDVAERLQDELGPIPMDRGWYLEIQAADGSQVRRGQGWVDGFLQQRLEVGRASGLDREDALEGLVWLLLNRWVVARQPVAERARGLATVPDWLAVGMAQHLYPELRGRNAKVVQQRWQDGRLTPWEDLVSQEILPGGRWAAKAEAGLLVGWLLDRRIAWAPVWSHCAAGGSLDADWLARHMLQLGDANAVTREWELWLAAQQDRQRVTRNLDPGQVKELEAFTRFDAADLAGVRADAEAPLTLADLIERRKSPWVPALARRRVSQMQLAMIGRSAEWQDAAGAYLVFLEALAGRRPGYSGGFWGRGPSARQLRSLLADADATRTRLEEAAGARQAYLDEVEARFQLGREGAMDSGWSESVARYLDEVEARQTAPASGEP